MTIPTSLKELANIVHPYYCSDSNYYSNEPSESYETAGEFLDDFADADIDLNLVFRWDIKRRDEEIGDNYYAEVFMMLQRKGIYKPIHIKHITQSELPKFMLCLETHYQRLMELWAPFEPATQPLPLTGFCDSDGTEICIGDQLKKATDCNKAVHGDFVVYEVLSRGAVPILSYVCSEKGGVLPRGYLALPLSELYDQKMFCFVSNTLDLRPMDEVEVVKTPHFK